MILRPSVQRFAEAMEEQLRKHDDRPGWRNADWAYLSEEMGDHIDTLIERSNDPIFGTQAIVSSAADIGNFAMMLAEVLTGDYADAGN